MRLMICMLFMATPATSRSQAVKLATAEQLLLFVFISVFVPDQFQRRLVYFGAIYCSVPLFYSSTFCDLWGVVGSAQ